MGKYKEIIRRMNANGQHPNINHQFSKNNGENQKQQSVDQASDYNRSSHVEPAIEKRIRIMEQKLRDQEASQGAKVEKISEELEQLKHKIERDSANGDNVVVSRSLLEALGIPREEAYPVHLLRDRFFELKLENRELKERLLQVTNKCDQPEKGEQEGEGVLQQQKTGQLSHSPAAKESVVNLVARIAELEKELAEARANNNKPEVDEEEEMKKKFQVILSNARNRELGRMQQSEAMFVLQGQLATSLSMGSQLYTENVLLQSKLIEYQCRMMTSSPPDFFTGDPLFSKIVFPSPPPSLAQLAIVEYGGCLQQKQLEK